VRIADEQMLRIAGKGWKESRRSTAIFTLPSKVAAHPEFHRKGSDLMRFPVDVIYAILAGRLWSRR